MIRISRDQWALVMARATSLRSTCLRRQVGCVLLNKRGHVLATGYNGVAAGMQHCNDDHGVVASHTSMVSPAHTRYPHACPSAFAKSGTNLDGCHAIHAEQNALLQCRDVYEIDTCYCTASPCKTCMKLLLNTSCQTIIYNDDYPHPDAIELWINAGRSIIRA